MLKQTMHFENPALALDMETAKRCCTLGCSCMSARLSALVRTATCKLEYSKKAIHFVSCVSPTPLLDVACAEAWALLLASLKSSCPKVQLEAAKAVCHLTNGSQQCQDAVVASGGLLHIGYQHFSSEALLIWSDGVD